MESMWSEPDSVDKALVVIGLSWAFFTAILPSRRARPDDTFFINLISSFARAAGILLAAAAIITVRHRL